MPAMSTNTHTAIVEIDDVKTARRVIGAICLHFLHGDTGRVVQQIADVVEGEIIHLRARDGGDCLGRFKQGQVEPGGSIGLALLPVDADRFQRFGR